MKRNRPGRPPHPDVLTPAEWRVLEVLRDGSTNAEIAARLGISRDTVKYHVSNMLAKLELDDRRALAAWRPGAERGRLRGLFAVPAALESLARVGVTVGVGVAAVAGVVVAVVAAVAVVAVVLVAGDGNYPLVAGPPPTIATPQPPSPTPITPKPTAIPAAAATVVPTATPPPTPAATPPPPAGSPAVTASPVPGSCTAPTDPTCVVAVYLGAPGDYAQVADIPANKLLTPASDRRYYVGRGQQVTVVTAAPLPEGWTRFYLQRTPLGTPSPVSAEQLIQPIGTTYTFTVSADGAAPTLLTFDLTAARPLPIQRPGMKPELGAVVVMTAFSVEATTFRYNRLDTTGAVATPGTYASIEGFDDIDGAIAIAESLFVVADGSTTGE